MKNAGVKKFVRRSAALVLSLVMLCSAGASGFGGLAQTDNVYYSGDEESVYTPVDNPNIESSKMIRYDAETGGFTLQMENYVTGSKITTAVTTMKATDFVLATDLSHSMPYCINCGNRGTVDSTSTGKFNNRAYCTTYALDIDTSLVYYTAWDMPSALYYCQSCERWYTEQHTGESHGGTEYLPAYYSSYWTADDQSASNTYFRQFYTQSGNVNCTGDVSCTAHGNWRHPIYADQLDYSAEYAWSAGNANGNNHAAWCDVCQVWRRCSDDANTSHADGGDHKLGRAYYPYRTAEDNETDTKVCIFRPPCVSRMTAAKNAISAFVDEVYRMSLGPDGITGTDDDIKHRVAIVGFGGDDNGDSKVAIETEDTKYTRTGIYSIWDSDEFASTGTDVNNFKSYYVFGEIGDGTPGAEADKAGYYYSHALRDVTSSKEMEVIQEGISELSYNFGTYINFGMEIAKGIFSSTYTEDPANTTNRNRVAVVFTDGKPDGDTEDREYDLGDESIQPSYDIKNSTTYGATVYTVGCFANANASLIWPLGDNAKEDQYMHMLSSNYPTAWEFWETGNFANNAYVKRDPDSENVETNWSKFEIKDVNENLLQRDENGNLAVDDSGNYILDPTKSGYYLTVTNADELVNAFEGIATESTTGGAYVSLDSTTVVQDVISDSWEIDGDLSGVSAYTMTYTGNDADGNKQWERKTDDVPLTPTVDGKTVRVTSFDFSANYVGVDIAADNTETPHGKKLVLEIPVQPVADNTGGTAQDTNVPESSGIIYDGEMQEHFASPDTTPSVDMPTTVSVKNEIVGANVTAETKIDVDLTMQIKSGYIPDGNSLKIVGTETAYQVSLASGASQEYADVVVGENITVKVNGVSDYKVEISPDGGTSWTALTVGADGTASHTFAVTPGMQIALRNTMQLADLTIVKTLTSADPDQSFIFSITGGGQELQVVIPQSAFAEGATSASVTVKDMEIGDYTITEKTDWSHRYAPTSVLAANDTDAVKSEDNTSITVTITPAGETVTFTNKRENPFWLSGDSWAEFWRGGN